jgi:putative ABC transport system permease protein
MIDSIFHDARYAIRRLAASPGFAFVAITSLALGIGANSTIFSLVRATQFPSLPYRESSQLVDLHETTAELCAGCGVGTSYLAYGEWKAQAQSFVSMGASREDEFVLSGAAEAVRVPGALVTFDLFSTLGVQPAIGRSFSADEDRVGGNRVILLSHGLWQRQFGSDSAAVGRTVRVNGVPTTIIGVMAKGFGYPEFAQMWAPMGAAIATSARDDRTVSVVARMAPGVTLERARSEIGAVGSRIASEHAADYRGWSATATPILDELRQDSGLPFLVLLGASAFVLLIACANLANLMLARTSRREREVAVRLAIGASRRRLVRMLLAESVLVSLIGGALGLILALWGVDAVPRLIATQIPFWIVFAVDWRVVLFALALSGLTSMAFGLVPALRASRPDLVMSLKDGAQNTTGSSRRGRLRSVLVVAQIACALVLLAGAGLMMKTFLRSRDMSNLGYDPRNVLTASVHTLQPRYDDAAQIGAFAASVEERVKSVPGVVAMSVEHTDFLGTFVGTNGNVTLEGSNTPVADNIVPRFSKGVSGDYFRVLRIPLRRGRLFSPSDRAGTPGVAVLNEAAAAALWPNGDAIGKRLKLGQPNDDHPWLTVVGIVGSTIASPLGRRRDAGFVYVPFAQQPSRGLTVLVRTAGPPLALASSVRAEIRAADPDAATDELSTMEASLSGWVGPVGFFVKLLGALATLAVGLAALGIYGVVSYTVAQRTREIGIRMALGATSRGILRLVVGYGVVLTGLGLAVGVAGSVALTGVLRGLLFGTSATDPVVFGAVSALLAAVSIAACYGPARRAVKVEPIVAIRYE